MDDEPSHISLQKQSFQEESSRNLEDWKEELIREQNMEQQVR